ncbi:MAG: TolC family protein [Planctomycetota bacterium]
MRRCQIWRGSSVTVFVLAFALAGCRSDTPTPESSISVYRDRMLARHQEETAQRRANTARPVAWQAHLPEKAALMTQPPTTTQPAPDEVLAEIPDPQDAPAVFQERLRRLRDDARRDDRVIRNYEAVVNGALQYLKAIERPQKLPLSLAECVQRALEHNYAIRFEAYNPAISQTQLVEAEAAFDAEFFLEGSWVKQDQATASAFQTGKGDSRSYQGGFRQLLPTGMQTSVTLSQQRQKTDLPPEFQRMNPTYSTNFTVALTQPLLRNFGLEVNRSQINIRRAERNATYETFIQKARDTLLDVESAYWRLLAARRNAALLAESVAQNKATYVNLQARAKHDVSVVELANAESRWQTREVEFQEAVKTVRDAEDALKLLLNDPDILLSHDIEIVPTEIPYVAALTLDQLAAARTGLESRSEIRQARHMIEQTRIGTMVAKNQTLPQLDLSFQYEVQGLNVSADSSFDNLTTNRFINYTVSVQFSYPLGNRARRAAHRRARLQESQAMVGLHQIMDGIVQEVNSAVRTLNVRYSQIPPQLQAVQASERNLRALQARAQKVDPLYLDNELGSVERLAGARQTLLQVVTEYNIAIVALERAKGTLLEYNNVIVTDEPPAH